MVTTSSSTPSPRKRSKGKRFAARCAFANKDFHCMQDVECTNQQHNCEELKKQLLLYQKLSSQLKAVIRVQNLSLPGLRYRKDKIKLCQHCVLKLSNRSEKQQQSSEPEAPFLEHSYSSTCSEKSSAASSDTDENDAQEFSPTASSTPLKQGQADALFPLSSETDKEKVSPGEKIIEQMKGLSQTELCKVAKFLGEIQNVQVKKDSTLISQNYQDLEYLTNINLEEWLSGRNPVVVNFVKGVSGLASPLKGRPLYSVAKSVEQVYNTLKSKHVMLLSFSENAVIHSIVNSKLACNINGLSSPGGSYWTLKHWLENQASSLLPPPVGDCLCAFDNDQVVGKTYHVRANSKVRVSVITSICMAEVDLHGELQKKSELKPSAWYDASADTAQILNYDSHHHKYLSDLHYKEMYNALKFHIEKVHKETVVKDDGTKFDEIDTLIADKQFQRLWKVCNQCNHHNPKTKRLCEKSSKSQQSKDQNTCTLPKKVQREIASEVSFLQEDESGGTSSMDTSATPTDCHQVHVLPRDPVFLNPNSFENVKEVFLAIGKDFQIRKYLDPPLVGDLGREWLVVVCDGLPYILGQRVIKETFHCQECQQAVFGRDSYEEHCNAAHNIEAADIVYSMEFDWVHLRIGYGHYEMNMVRSFIELNWDIMVKDLAYCMGFCTENAQKYAKKASDHHKSWELLCILYEGSVEELLLPYVRSCVESQVEPSPVGYLLWTENVKSPKYQYLQEQVFTYLQSIRNFRKGVRNNDKDLIMAGKYKHAPIFHGRNHPKYSQIELIEAKHDIIMPPLVKEFVHSHQSVSQSGQAGRGEDMDFQLENLNKRSKVWTPKGVPSEADWLRTFRNLEKLDKVQYHTLFSFTFETIYVNNSTVYSVTDVAVCTVCKLTC
ncbi:hypothetical protein HOLleu_37485 [Holothuria leucospilota]|uniref:C2H2-type domain-containing protein n=1 Tax=Holothuria leucospilota TaxID=206669 RepID=A0A9Q0YI47_HOLLE|nr:hypothetical protein HOLleu_37485 [Holothuria leucospilota]